jgi:hypothetical protein
MLSGRANVRRHINTWTSIGSWPGKYTIVSSDGTRFSIGCDFSFRETTKYVIRSRLPTR